MSSVAILIGNAVYRRLPRLDCCVEDLQVMEALIAAIGRHDVVRIAADADADAMRNVVREALAASDGPEELLFYFSGHGSQIGAEFYFCGAGFDPARPNETGLSHGELHEMLRSVEPGLLVNIVDACASGTPLIKAGPSEVPLRKDGLRNVLQLSSCMSDQSSFTGERLSEFTGALLSACLRRSDGPIFYSDVIATLRDDFLDNEDQIPFFVSQGTGRELLVDDAAKLAGFRARYADLLYGDEGEDEEISGNGGQDEELSRPPTMFDLLSRAERRMATPEKADRLIASIFDGVSARLCGGETGEMFEAKSHEHASFKEPTAEDFVARTLARETRPDNLVHAAVRRVTTNGADHASTTAALAALTAFGQFGGVQEKVTLQLNCSLARAQLKLTFTPRFQSLQRMVLVLTCAPSLERCYVFEILTRHQRSDWDSYTQDGAEVAKRWYKLDWEQDTSFLVDKICAGFEGAVRSHVESTVERLADG